MEDYRVQGLDVGCWHGDIGLRLMKILPVGSRYTGVDIHTVVSLALARERFTASGY